jgi:hypothetical protein
MHGYQAYDHFEKRPTKTASASTAGAGCLVFDPFIYAGVKPDRVDSVQCCRNPLNCASPVLQELHQSLLLVSARGRGLRGGLAVGARNAHVVRVTVAAVTQPTTQLSHARQQTNHRPTLPPFPTDRRPTPRTNTPPHSRGIVPVVGVRCAVDAATPPAAFLALVALVAAATHRSATAARFPCVSQTHQTVRDGSSWATSQLPVAASR